LTNQRTHDLRILLVGFKDRAAERAVEGLRARGVSVDLASDATEAIAAVRLGRLDLVCLHTPPANVDLVGLCAALKEGPAPPGLLLLDSAERAAPAFERLPEELRPDAILTPPLDADRLLVAIEGMWGGTAPAPDPATPGRGGPSLAELLVELKARRETGVIEVRADGVRTDIHLHAGDPVLAEGGTIRETLGRLLMRRGALREEDYVRVIQRMTDSLVEHEPLRMGEALVELGLLTPVEVYEALVTQVQEKVVACFRFEQVDLSFRPLAALPEHVGAFRCAPAEVLVLRGAKAHFDARRVDSVLASHEARHPLLREDATALAERFQLDPAEQRFLRGLTGERTLSALRQDGTLDALHAGQLLAALAIGRVLEFRDRPIPKTPSGAAASAARAVAKPDPVRAAAPQSTQRSVRPEEALRRLKSTLALRTAPHATRLRKEAELGAEQSFQRGKQLLRQGLLPGAAKEFERALSLRPGEPEYQLHAAWTASLAAGDAPARSSARKRAREVALQLIRHDKNHAKAHAILGQMLLEEGDGATAEKHFRIALATDPKEIDAERGLRLATRRREKI
jgi:tetratricopeptide (TPR) repeat protein